MVTLKTPIDWDLLVGKGAARKPLTRFGEEECLGVAVDRGQDLRVGSPRSLSPELKRAHECLQEYGTKVPRGWLIRGYTAILRARGFLPHTARNLRSSGWIVDPLPEEEILTTPGCRGMGIGSSSQRRILIEVPDEPLD